MWGSFCWATPSLLIGIHSSFFAPWQKICWIIKCSSMLSPECSCIPEWDVDEWATCNIIIPLTKSIDSLILPLQPICPQAPYSPGGRLHSQPRQEHDAPFLDLTLMRLDQRIKMLNGSLFKMLNGSLLSFLPFLWGRGGWCSEGTNWAFRIISIYAGHLSVWFKCED